MDEQRLPKRPGKSVCKHQRIVQTEVAHVIVAFQFTTTKRKVFVGMEQTTELALQVADVKLVAPRGQNVYEGHAVTGVYIPYQFGIFG